MEQVNEHGQPVGEPVPGWRPPDERVATVLEGRWVRLEPLAHEHDEALHEATCGAGREASWTYLSDEMPVSGSAFVGYVERRLTTPGMASLAIVPLDGTPQLRPRGMASYLRITPSAGSVEVGNILFSPALQRTTAATEAMYLMAAHAFDLGYRRYEWKCDALNAPSRAAAERLGFTFEGLFRQALVYKGRNRDTAWFAITDRDWPALRAAYETWLQPENFADPATGTGQRRALSELTAAARSTG